MDTGGDNISRPVPENEPGSTALPPSIEKVQELLQAEDDTSRFVGLALLKSLLDNTPDLQRDGETLTALWHSISPRFLDRLLRTGSRPGSRNKDAKDMLDLSVSVIHTFGSLLPEEVKNDRSMVGRIPKLTEAILQSSRETTTAIVQTLSTLVSTPQGGRIFGSLEDWSPLVEIALTEPAAMTVLSLAWIRGSHDPSAYDGLREKINDTIQSLAIVFKGTDAVTFLDFIASTLRHLQSLNPTLLPQDPEWLGSLIAFIRKLAIRRPTPESRSASTTAASTLLLVFPVQTPSLLFADEAGEEKPFAYLFINLLLVDLRATIPSLLESLNAPGYPSTLQRLVSALEVLAAFIGFLMSWVAEMDEAEDSQQPGPAFKMPPDLLLKLNKAISETFAVVIEYMRDRWDASLAGAAGLHPEARIGAAHTSSGSHRTLSWDTKTENAAADPFIYSAMRALALWLREDDSEGLRNESAGLMDMFMELYANGSTSSESRGPDFREPVLVALEGITRTQHGIDAFLSNDGWAILSQDLLHVLSESSAPRCSLFPPSDFVRGSRITLILGAVADQEGSTQESWMDVVTAVAGLSLPDDHAETRAPDVVSFWVSVMQLAAELIAKASPGLRMRYVHSARAVLGLARVVRERTEVGSTGREGLDDAIAMLSG